MGKAANGLDGLCSDVDSVLIRRTPRESVKREGTDVESPDI
jgi:hypothetical protein